MRRKDKKPQNIRQPLPRSSNPKAFSYYSTRPGADNGVNRLKKEVRKSFQWQLIPSFAAAFVILASLVYMSGLDTNPRLSLDKSNKSAMLQPETVYYQAAQKLMQGSIFNKSKLTVNTRAIEAKLLAEFPELKTAAVTVPLASRRPIIVVKAIDPRLLLVTDQGSYIIDSTGRATVKTADKKLASKLGIPAVEDQAGLDVQVGKVLLSAREAAFISELKHQLDSKKLKFQSMTLPPLLNELRVRPAGQKYFVKFNTLGDARQQAGTYLATRQRLNRSRITPARYIDVRVEEKAFYK